jgi:hypothetical protein
MSKASSRADAGAEPIERLQHWIAVCVSVLLHVLLLMLAILAPPIDVTPPEGADADAGGRMAVAFVGEAPPPPSLSMSSRPPATPPPASRVQTTPVPRAIDPVPPAAPDEPAQGQADASAATTPPASTVPWRRAHTWGQPPGMLPEESAPVNAGLARSPAQRRGRGDSAANTGPSLEVGGYQVYYDLRSERTLRAWRDQGMTELFLPLPGTRQYMVCPLETALKRESGPCRLIEPDSPELEALGDAREGIDMQRVYRQGEVVWRGPGPYR